MKKSIFLLSLIMIIATGCSTVNQSINQAGTSAIQLEPEVKVGKKIEGSSKTVFLLGFLDLSNLPGSNKKYIDGVNVGGGGHLVEEISLSVGEEGKVIGIDPSQDQLDVASNKCKDQNNIELICTTADDINIDDASCDKITATQTL